MTHTELTAGELRAFVDGEVTPDQAREISQHLRACQACDAALHQIQGSQSIVVTAMGDLPGAASGEDDRGRIWAAFERKRAAAANPRWHWSPVATWWTAAGGALATVLLLLTLAPVRAWAQEMLSLFRVEHLTVLELNPETAASLGNNRMLNQSVGRMLSDRFKVTEPPQPEQVLKGEAEAQQRAGFAAKFLPGVTPSSLLLESGAAAQVTLDRARLQAILDEAGRGDLQIPWSVDGAVVSFRVAPGIVANYDQCWNGQPAPQPQTPCISLMQVPSPVVAAPQGFNPAQIAQIGLEFLGMSASDAANFTQTVDWTSTLVLPIDAGTMTYKELPINGVQGVLLRAKQQTGRYTLTWVDYGIVYAIQSYGDDASAVGLAAQLN